MSNLEEYLGIEKLDKETANKASGYAWVTYLDQLSTSEVNANGQIMQFNREHQAGQTDLVSTSELQRLGSNFPTKVKGKAINFGNLENMISYCFDELKREYAELGVEDQEIAGKIAYLEGFFQDGKLTADHQTESSLRDLANKVFNFQEQVRNLQSRTLRESTSKTK